MSRGRLPIAGILLVSFVWLLFEMRPEWFGVVMGLFYGALWGSLLEAHIRDRADKPSQ